MYLSRLTLNPRTRRVQRELADPYQLHRTLLSAFPPKLPPGERVLYRVDVDPHTSTSTLLLQSHTHPDWAWLGDPRARDYLLRAPETKDFELTFSPGQTLAFRLRANPTLKCWLPKEKADRDSEKKPMRVPVTGDDELKDWLRRKGAHGGFLLVTVQVRGEGTLTGWQAIKPKIALDVPGTTDVPTADGADTASDTPENGPRRPKRKLTFRAVTFEGVLQVTDPDAFWQTVQQGVGPAKSFGFGLLSLARG